MSNSPLTLDDFLAPFLASVDKSTWREALRETMQQRGLSARALSMQAGLSEAYAAALFQDRNDPTFTSLLKIASVVEQTLGTMLAPSDPQFQLRRLRAICSLQAESDTVTFTPANKIFEIKHDVGESDILVHIATSWLSPRLDDGDVVGARRLPLSDLKAWNGKLAVVATIEGLRIGIPYSANTDGECDLLSATPRATLTKAVGVRWIAPVQVIFKSPTTAPVDENRNLLARLLSHQTIHNP